MASKPLPVRTNSSLDVINAIRNSASINYRNYVPLAYESSDLRTIGGIIMDMPELQNEFINTLINRIARMMITSESYQNPWKALKKGILSRGETIEEVFADLAQGYAYDADADGSDAGKLFKRYTPDIHTAFHYTNVLCYYPISVEIEMLERAFTDTENMDAFIKETIIGTVYDGMEYDEFNMIKYTLAKRIINGLVRPVSVASASTTSDVVSVIKGVSNEFRFKNTKYNPAGVRAKSDPTQQYIIVNSAFDATMSVDVLAAAFNMDKAEFVGHKLLVDDFGEIDEARLASIIGADAYEALTTNEKNALKAVPAVLVDERFFQIYDKYIRMKEQENGLSLRWNYFLHNAKIYSTSPFANAAVFVNGVPAVSTVELTPATVTASAGQTVQLTAKTTTAYFAPKGVIYTITGATSDDTHITASGVLHIASDETGTLNSDTSAYELTVTATSVFDSTKTDSTVVTIAS